MKPFRLFWRAVKSTRHEMWVSVQVLVAITLVLSLLLYLVEHHAQPEVFHNYWDALLWSFMGYIDDPGEFATYTPITFWGRVLKIMCALVNIAIFAVPAGLVAGGFSEAIAEDKHERELEEMRSRLARSFRRILRKKPRIRTVPRYVSLANIQVNQQIDTKDIIDAVRTSDGFRLCNLADAQPSEIHPQDRLVVETIPTEGRTSYGCCIDRGSKVTIVAPLVYKEVATSNFFYYFALFAGFNYISLEYPEILGDYNSYYVIDDEKSSSVMMDFLADVRRFSKGDNRWTMAMIVADSGQPANFHFITATKSELGITSTIIDKEKFDELYQAISNTMKEEYNLESDLNIGRYKPAGPKNICVKAGGGNDRNAFTLRVDWNIVAYEKDHLIIAFTLAQQMAKILEGKTIEIKQEWISRGYGY